MASPHSRNPSRSSSARRANSAMFSRVTTGRSPRTFAAWGSRVWPTCMRSKQPFVDTMRLPAWETATARRVPGIVSRERVSAASPRLTRCIMGRCRPRINSRPSPCGLLPMRAGRSPLSSTIQWPSRSSREAQREQTGQHRTVRTGSRASCCASGHP